jgi:tetratricopeptide (TPR) repeat protein
MKPQNLLIFVFLILSWTNFSFAQEGDAGQPGEFLRYGVGGRALGMGRAYVALANDASGVYWNPAGVISGERKQFSAMYTNLFYDTQYSYLAMSYPRLFKRPVISTIDWLTNVLFGPEISLGIGFMDLSTADFDQRDEHNNHLGNFGIHNRALLLSFSTQRVNTWGIFNYGWTFKKIIVEIPGLKEYDVIKHSWYNPFENIGIDFGFICQPINFPVLKVFTLKYLMPFKFGFNIQNLLSPKIKVQEHGATEKYLPALRYGWSYALILSERSKLTLVNDYETLYDNIWTLDAYENRKTGVYFGSEFQIRLRDVVFSPRLGFNNQTEKITFGGGLQLDLSTKTSLKIDYAFGSHTYLGSDHRFFLTFEFGKSYNANHFENKAKESVTIPDSLSNLLQIIAKYPNDKVREAAIALARFDSANAGRYYRLIGELEWADWLFKQAKENLKNGKVNSAKSKAEEAIEVYAPVFDKTVKKFSDSRLLNYAEALIILDRWEDAINVVAEVQTTSLRRHYLLGISYKNKGGNWDEAIEEFKQVLSIKDEDKSMLSLSYLGLAECLMENKKYDLAIENLKTITSSQQFYLDKDYPRYPIFKDKSIKDDAQYLIGECYLNSSDKEKILKAREAFANVFRFYAKLEKAPLAEVRVEELINRIQK